MKRFSPILLLTVLACGQGVDVLPGTTPYVPRDAIAGTDASTIAESGPFDPGGSISDKGSPIDDPGTSFSDPGTPPFDSGQTELPDWQDNPCTGIYTGLCELSGQALVTELCHLVKDHYNGVSYDKAGDLIKEDIDNYGGKVWEIYVGEWVKNGSGLNIEHTWPQSKGAEGQAKSDIFHLFPSWPSYNSPRGNLPFGEVVVQDWPDELLGDPTCDDFFTVQPSGCLSIRGKDAQNVKVFEPRDGHKGDAARAVFYFSLRYGSNCKVKSLKVFDESHPAVTETVMKAWNRLDPPDTREMQRNDRVEDVQNMRNPFIDHPEFIDRISFL